MRLHSLLAVFVCAALSVARATPAQDLAKNVAANFPSKPVTVIIPFVPGVGSAEARLYTDKLSTNLGQPFVFDHKPGAGGSIGVMFALKAPSDGYTIMMTSASLPVIPNFYPEINHSVVSQLVPITQMSSRTTGIIISPAALPNVRSLLDIVAYAKNSPAQLKCYTAGAGSITHIVCAYLANVLGIEILPIHYKGQGQSQVDLMAGRIHLSTGTLLANIGHIKSGKLRAIAVIGSNRTALLPEVPTAHEQGYELVYPSWLGAFAPPKTPMLFVNKLNIELVKAIQSPDVIAALEKGGAVPVGNSPEAFRKSFASELTIWKKVVEDNKIQAADN